MTSVHTFLSGKSIPYEILEHSQPIRSAQDGADYFGIELGQTAPTLVLETESGFVAAILTGDRGRLDFQAVAAILSRQEVKLASPKRVEQVTGCKIGTVPLVGLTLPCLFDRRLLRYGVIYGGTGEAGSTLKIAPKAVEEINRVIAYLE